MDVPGERGFRRLGRDDLPLLHAWLRLPHVREWWGDNDAYDAVVAEYLPAIDGREPTELWLLLLDARPVGFVQTYAISDHPDYAALIGVGPGVAGVDLFLAEPELLGRGLGSELLRRFVEEIVFARPGTTAACADPDVRNTASLQAFAKAGFAFAREFVDPEDGQTHALVVRER